MEFLMDDHRLNLNNQWVNMARLGGVLLLLATAVVILLFGLQMQASAEIDVVGVGLVTDGSVDSPWNELSHQGLLRAESELGVVGTVYTPTNSSEYISKLQQCVIDGNELCLSVGFLMNEATATMAQLYPNQKFAIVDNWFFDGEGNKVTYDNVKELTFRVDQAAFMTGYVAAGTTLTGKVGTYGGLPIASVVNFMDGFWYGVQYYNQQNGTNVEVLGWNPETLSGYFTNNFDSYDDGYNMGLKLIGEGADIILCVASTGPGMGTMAAAKDHGNTYIVGADFDWYDIAGSNADIILTSVLKKMDVAVYDTIKSVVDSDFKGGLYIGTLENDGVAIAPFHDLENFVPPKVKADLDNVTSGIIDGTITVNHPCGQHIGWMLRLRSCRVNLPIILRNYCSDFFDDFNNRHSGWFVWEDEYAQWEYLDGEYRILTKDDSYGFYYAHAPTCARENYTVEVDARWVGDPGSHYGIFWDSNRNINDQFYMFGVNTDYQDYYLDHYDGVEWHTIIPWTVSPYINGGTASNHLKITRNGFQITLEVNGIVLVTLTDANLTGRTYTGIFSGSYIGYPTSDARFDNFSVTQVKSVGQSSGIHSDSPAPVISARLYKLALHRQGYLTDSEQLIR